MNGLKNREGKKKKERKKERKKDNFNVKIKTRNTK